MPLKVYLWLCSLKGSLILPVCNALIADDSHFSLLLNVIFAVIFALGLTIFWKHLNKRTRTEGITAIELVLGLALVLAVPASIHHLLSWTVVTIAASGSSAAM